MGFIFLFRRGYPWVSRGLTVGGVHMAAWAPGAVGAGLFVFLTITILLKTYADAIVTRGRGCNGCERVISSLVRRLATVGRCGGTALPPVFCRVEALRCRVSSLAALGSDVLRHQSDLIGIVRKEEESLGGSCMRAFEGCVPCSRSTLTSIFAVHDTFKGSSLRGVLADLGPRGHGSLTTGEVERCLCRSFPSLVKARFGPFAYCALAKGGCS